MPGLGTLLIEVRRTFKAALGGDGTRGRLARRGVGTLVVSGAGALVSFAVSVLLARVLGTEGFGLYSLAMSVAVMLMVLVRLGFPELLVREVARLRAKGDEAGIGTTVAAADRVSMLSGLTLIMLGSTLVYRFDVFGADPVVQMTAVAVTLLVVTMAVTDNQSGALRGLSEVVRGQLPPLVVRPALLAVTVLLSIAWGVKFSASRAMWVHVFAGVCAWALARYWLRRHLPAGGNESSFKGTTHLIRASMPFASLSLLGVLGGQLEILLLGSLGEVADVGIYRVALAISVFGAFFLVAASLVSQPEVARLHAEGRRLDLQRLIRGQTLITSLATLPLLSLFLAAGVPFLRLVYGEAYVGAYLPMTILLVGQALNIAVGPVGMVLNMTGNERETIRGRLLGLGVGALAGFILIPRFGSTGAAISAALSMVTWNVHMAIAVTRLLDISFALWHYNRP